MGQEHRQAPRIPIRLTTWIKLPQTGRVLRVLTDDISSLGLRVTVEASLAAGATVGLELKLPDREQTIHATGEVMWSRAVDVSRVGVGVKFLTIDPKDLVLIHQYVAPCAPPPAP